MAKALAMAPDDDDVEGEEGVEHGSAIEEALVDRRPRGRPRHQGGGVLGVAAEQIEPGHGAGVGAQRPRPRTETVRPRPRSNLISVIVQEAATLNRPPPWVEAVERQAVLSVDLPGGDTGGRMAHRVGQNPPELTAFP